MKVHNVHERTVAATQEQITPLIANFDRIWPTQLTPAPRAGIPPIASEAAAGERAHHGVLAAGHRLLVGACRLAAARNAATRAVSK